MNLHVSLIWGVSTYFATTVFQRGNNCHNQRTNRLEMRFTGSNMTNKRTEIY